MTSLARYRLPLLLTLGVFCLYLFTASVETTVQPYDAGAMLQDAQRLGRYGFAAAADAPAFSKYGLGQPLLDLTVVGFWSRAATAPDSALWLGLGVALLPAALGAATVLLVWLCAGRLGLGPRAAVAGALLVGLTTMVWPYTQTLLSDPTLGVLWLLAFYALLRGREGHWAWFAVAGASAGYAVLTKVTAGGPLLVLAGYCVWAAGRAPGRRWPRVAAFLVAALPLGVALLAYNQLRYGSVFDFGYGADRDGRLGFNTPLLVGLYGLLLSSGKGLFWYNPLLLLLPAGARVAWRRWPAETLTCLALVGITLLLHARWWAWHGDWAWGPRFLVGGVPFLALLVLPLLAVPGRRWRWAIGLLAGVGVAVQCCGLTVPFNRYGNIVLRDVGQGSPPPAAAGAMAPAAALRDDSLHVHFIPEYSPLAGHAWMLHCLLAPTPEAAARRRAAPPWLSLNPQWQPASPNVAEDFHWNIWWAFAWQFRERLGVAPAAIIFLPLALAAAGLASLALAWVSAGRPTVSAPAPGAGRGPGAGTPPAR